MGENTMSVGFCFLKKTGLAGRNVIRNKVNPGTDVGHHTISGSVQAMFATLHVHARV